MLSNGLHRLVVISIYFLLGSFALLFTQESMKVLGTKGMYWVDDQLTTAA